MAINVEILCWLSGLLLIEYAFSEGTFERGTYVGERNFGHSLARSAFRTTFRVSINQCATECVLRKQRCKSFNYRRIYLSCQLCEEDSGPGGINLQPEHDSIHSNIYTWKKIPVGHCNEINCSWTQRCDPSNPDIKTACVQTDCPFPEIRPGVTIDPSDETSVGTHVWQRCEFGDMQRGNRLTTCLESTAEWSATDFKCVCKTPPVIPGAINATVQVEVGQTYTYSCQDGLFGKRNQNATITCLRDGCKTPPVIPGTINETVEVEVGQKYTYRCLDGLFGKANQNPTVTCLWNGSWTSTNFTCACNTPPVILWTINATTEVTVGQNYTYRCLEGMLGKLNQNPTVTWLLNGTWTSNKISCVCPTPPTKLGTQNERTNVEVGQSYTYICIQGLFKKGDENTTVTCLSDGNWTSTKFFCVKQNWMQDKIYPSNTHKSDVISNETGIDLFECMQRCDSNQIDNCSSYFYDNHNNHCVLSSSFRRGIPQGLEFSAGWVYYKAPSASCDMGYSNVSLGGSYFCIKFHRKRQTFNEGMKTCESEKAKLLSVTTKAQIKDANTFLGTAYDYVYIGVSDEIDNGHWVSWDGEEVSIFWDSNASQGNNSVDNCGVIHVHPTVIGVIDHTCNHNHSFICCKNEF